MEVSEDDKSVFAERGYTFHQLLGEGTYARVWLVNYSRTDDNITRDYSLACKVIDNERTPRDFTKKFLPREIDVLSKIRHPHLIHLHSMYERKTKIFIFMRYAEKGDLLDYILINGEVKEDRARLWTHQLSLGLQYLHELDIVHRDIKCENVLITINNNVKLADFGFSRFIIDPSGRRYLSSTYCGSIAYAAPELLKGKPYDPKCSDIWSLGIVLYVMLNQCLPFNDADLKKLYQFQMGCKWSFRHKIALRLSEDVKALVCGMLRPDVATRFLIKDVVNSTWFLADKRLKLMSGKEREALEVGKRNKLEMIPKSQKFTVQFWKKKKKLDEQIVRITSLRIEQSSDQINLDVSSSKIEDVNLTENVEIMSKIKGKDDDMKEEVYKNKSTTMEIPAGALPDTEKLADDLRDSEQRRKQGPKYSAGKQKATTSTVGVGSTLSRTEKFISVTETPAAINYSGTTLSEKPFTALKRVSSSIAKQSNILLITDQTITDDEIEEESIRPYRQSASEAKENVDKMSKPSQPDSEGKN